jgi:SAM-dependent methyltransferase
MSQERMTELFFEMFTGLRRQGPGDEASTLRALGLVPLLGPQARILDVGCGTGAQTLVLAGHTPARIVAVDNHAPFVEELNRSIQALGLGARVEARVGDMTALDFAPGSFDLIWSEGAIFVIGFERGLREWRRLLKPDGHVAVTEAAWLRDDPPPECAAFWQREYPAICDATAHRAVIEACGYARVGDFVVPASSWWDDYYRPLEQHVAAFRTRHPGEGDALALADQIQQEIEIWRRYSDYYSYVFYVMRRAD